MKPIHLVIMCAVVVSCKVNNEGGDSENKFDQSTANALNYADLPDYLYKTICKKNAFIMFVGNGESAIVDAKDKRSFASQKLMDVVAESKSSLLNALGKLPAQCNPKMNQERKEKVALALVVTDGPGRGDSKIESVWYSFDMKRPGTLNEAQLEALDKNGPVRYSKGWQREAQSQYWKVVDGKVVETTAEDTHELHLPTQIELIARHFTSNKPKDEPYFRFTQSVYLFKSHGSKFQKKQSLSDLGLYVNLNRSTPAPMAGHAFLFDQYGPKSETPITADLFTPDLPIKDACKKFAEVDPTKYGFAKPDMCGRCAPYKAEVSHKKAFSKCSFVAPSTAGSQGTLDVNSDTTLDVNSDTTLDVNSDTTLDVNSDTTLDVNSDTTLDVNSDTTLDVNSDTTLDVNSDTTLDINSDTTLDPNGANTLDPASSGDTLGGKNLVFHASSTRHENFRQLASGVLYSADVNVRGLHNVKLPLIGTETTPPLIVLDSCWGSTRIAADAFDLLVEKDGEEGDQPAIVTMINPNPMHMSALDYGVLDYFQLMSLSRVYSSYYTNLFSYWSRKIINKIKETIDYHFFNNGLDHDGQTVGEVDITRSPRIYVIYDGEVQTREAVPETSE